jgi:hypothetical protein
MHGEGGLCHFGNFMSNDKEWLLPVCHTFLVCVTYCIYAGTYTLECADGDFTRGERVMYASVSPPPHRIATACTLILAGAPGHAPLPLGARFLLPPLSKHTEYRCTDQTGLTEISHLQLRKGTHPLALIGFCSYELDYHWFGFVDVSLFWIYSTMCNDKAFNCIIFVLFNANMHVLYTRI